MKTKGLFPVDGHPDLLKDNLTGMIVNINKDKIDSVREVRRKKAEERQEIENLKSDIRDIKAMLQKLLENGSNA